MKPKLVLKDFIDYLIFRYLVHIIFVKSFQMFLFHLNLKKTWIHIDLLLECLLGINSYGSIPNRLYF